MSRILIVDDEPSTLELLKFILEVDGYEVLVASTGVEAISLVCTNAVDLVISDLMMPGMDGRELYKLIRRRDSSQSLPIVLTTAAPDISKAKLEKEGYLYAAVLPKPFDPEMVTRIAARFLPKSKSA